MYPWLLNQPSLSPQDLDQMGVSMPRPITCRICGDQLFPQHSPLCYAASKRRLCPDCFTEAEFAKRERARPTRKPGLCEHLWGPWTETGGYVFGAPPPSPNHDLYTRSCELCGSTDATYSLETPAILDEFNIDWCDKSL